MCSLASFSRESIGITQPGTAQRNKTFLGPTHVLEQEAPLLMWVHNKTHICIQWKQRWIWPVQFRKILISPVELAKCKIWSGYIHIHTSAHCINRDQSLSQWPRALQVDWYWVTAELIACYLTGRRPLEKVLKMYENMWESRNGIFPANGRNEIIWIPWKAKYGWRCGKGARLVTLHTWPYSIIPGRSLALHIRGKW